MTKVRLPIDAISALGNYPALKREGFPRTVFTVKKVLSNREATDPVCVTPHTGRRRPSQ
jgi:hypothetical protein